MTKTILMMLAATSLAGCSADPVSTSGTNNPKVPVSLLFEHEGCRVYRFTDAGRERYFANCPSTTTVSSHHMQPCGKGCNRYVPEDTTTEYTK